MATITENLQIIHDSRMAIKQAIIDKGGEVGDLTTYADAIANLPSEGGNNKKITFTGNISPDKISGTLTGLPERGRFIVIYTGDLLSIASRLVESDGYVNIYIDPVPIELTIIKLLFCPLSVFQQMPLYAGNEIYDVKFIQE